MADWDTELLWGFMFLLAGAVGQQVNYPGPVCAVAGSTVTLPCSFTHKDFFSDNGKLVPIKIVRVRWCKNHAICYGSTPSVYDSNPPSYATSDPRYKYLGDMERNCTLQITDVNEDDQGTLRFRMEADHREGHYTNQTGVKVTVREATRMRIKSSSSDRVMNEGQSVTLQCTADCTFLPLKVKWYRDDLELSEHGPDLQIHSLTAKDSGNYTCELQSKSGSRSAPYSLKVEEQIVSWPLRVAMMFRILLVVVAVITGICIIRSCATVDVSPGTISKFRTKFCETMMKSKPDHKEDRLLQLPEFLSPQMHNPDKLYLIVKVEGITWKGARTEGESADPL